MIHPGAIEDHGDPHAVGVMNIACNSPQLVAGTLLVPLKDTLYLRQLEYDVVTVNEWMRLLFQFETYSSGTIQPRNNQS